MNQYLPLLQAYPFEKLRVLLHGVTPPAMTEIKFGIGEPQHPTPSLIQQALVDNLASLANYPTTLGQPALRRAIADWLQRRYAVQMDPEREILPVNGSREALFSFTQTVLDSSKPTPLVVSPNPFYQIYEGATLLAGGQVRYLNTCAADDFSFHLDEYSAEEWQHVQLMFVCSPSNPTGKVLQLADWQQLFEYADRYGFILASDECYSEIYPDEDHPPIGILAAATQLGRSHERLMMFSSLSKRSNVPGLRSGFVAGDADLIAAFFRYRTYHGSAMGPAVQAASIAAWQDEQHVIDNRRLYREKFQQVRAILAPHVDVRLPDGGFYLWLPTPINDEDFTRALYEQYHVGVLPGRYLARDVASVNPGANYIRIALVASLADCLEGAERIVALLAKM